MDAAFEGSGPGPRKLHDEVTAAYHWWRDHDQPAARDWLVTIDRHGQHVELAPG